MHNNRKSWLQILTLHIRWLVSHLTYNILRITIVYVFEQHEYLISCHLIWAVLCQPLYYQEGSLKSIKYLLRCLSLEYYLMVSDVQRTYVQQGLV